MALRAKRSFPSIRRSLTSSFIRFFTCSSPLHTFQRTSLTPRPRYFGSKIGNGTAIIREGQANSLANYGFIYQLCENRRMFQATQSFYRSYASASTSKGTEAKNKEARKDISTVDDPFDSPTYHIPEKPVTFTEGASYGVVILVGLGIAGAAAYGVFKELIFEPKEYKIFNKALEKIQNDSQVRVRIGSPIKGYGQETRNRAARQRIPHRIWTDEDGMEHIEVNFHIRGPNGDGKVYCEMFKDKSDNQWKYQYLIIDIFRPSPMKLMLESYLPTTA